MPCYSTGTAEGDARLAAAEEAKHAALLENMLCGLCTRIEAGEILSPHFINDDPTLKAWWARHKKADKRKKALEEADKKRSALSIKARRKLTKAELEALGIR